MEIDRALIDALAVQKFRSAGSARLGLELNLFEDVVLAAELSAVTNVESPEVPGGTLVWTGKLTDQPLSDVILAVTGDIVSGNVTTGEGQRYFIRPSGAGHVIQESDAAGFPAELEPVPGGTEAGAVAEVQAKPGPRLAGVDRAVDDGSTIDVMVVYSASARGAVGGAQAMANQIALAVTEANQGYANSGIIQRIRLVHSVEVSMNDGAGFSSSLDEITDGTGPFAGVRGLRDQHKADLVSLWINNGSGCGLSWLMQSNAPSFQSKGFSVVHHGCAVSNFSFAHELGHNMGATHDRGNAGGAGVFPYSYGFQQNASAPFFRTIMAYECSGGSCPRINYWSNPAVSYQGRATGVAQGNANAADNRTTLDQTRVNVANFRSASGSAVCTYSLSPSGITMGAAGGVSSVGVTAGSGCAWTAVSNAAWITVTSGASGSGSGTVGYTVAGSSGAARSGTISIGGQTFTVNQGAGCSFSLSAASASVPSSGSSGSVNVAAGGGCGWSAVSNASWITITAGASGSGSGTVSFNVASTTGAARSGTISIAGQTYTVNQGSGCSFGLSAASASVPSSGGAGSVNVTAGGGCGWSAVSNAAWITITAGASGSGSGTVSFSVASTTGASRSGTISIAGHTYTVSQGAGCTFGLSAPSTSVPSSGGAGSVNVTAGGGCGWSAVSNAAWITITGGANGSGSGTVSFSVASTTGASRSGTISIAGQTYTVSQGAGCSYGLSANTANLPPNGGTSSVNVSSGAGCAWSATSNAPWLSVTSGASGSGNGAVAFQAGSNGGASRSGTISIAGQTLTVTQSACSYSLSSTSGTVLGSGGGGSFGVVASGGCTWSAASNAPWISLTAGTSGNGSGTVSFQAAANGSTASRTGTITAAGQTYTVTQTSGVTILQPTANQVIPVSGVTFQWSSKPSATGYDLRVSRSGALVFQGSLAGNGSTSTLVSLPAGNYAFSVRDCAGAFSDAACGPFASVNFSVSLTAPSSAPSVLAPAAGQNFNSSTQTLRWSSVAGADSYEVMLTDAANGGQTELMQTLFGAPPPTETVYSMHSSAHYQLKVRACGAACGPWSAATSFSVSLPAVPSTQPSAPSCILSNGNGAACNWPPVPGADFYVLQVLQPNAGPGGGVLTVASRRTTATAIAPGEALALPPGRAFAVVSACNGNGCSPASAGTELNPSGASPNTPVLGNPISGSTTSSPEVFFSWNRVPGDNGSNTVYRLFALDFSTGRTALDVLTTSNFYAAKFRAGGARHDALVIAHPDTASQVTGPASAFVVRGSSGSMPTLTQPRHQTAEVGNAIRQGNVQLGWTPVTGATLYEYFVARAGDGSPTVRGVTPGLFVQVPLGAAGGATTYSGIVRACLAANCAFGSDAGWGPWSNSPGGPGVTTFRVAP